MPSIDCTVINFTKAPQSDVNKWLQKRGIEKFNVAYQCDILTFDSEIYRQENKYYLLSPALGPCGKENVYYIDSARISFSEWFKTKYLLEWQVINRNLKNREFCVSLENKIYGERGTHCR